MLEPTIASAIERRERAADTRKERLIDEINRSSVYANDGIPANNTQAQTGRPLFAAVLEKRLLSLNPNFIFEVAIQDSTKKGIYVPQTRRDEAGFVYPEKRFVCGYENGIMPEFSIIHTRDKKLPDPNDPQGWVTVQEPYRETRGWRTVLLRLIRERLITEAGADKAFQVSLGRSSERWQKGLQ